MGFLLVFQFFPGGGVSLEGVLHSLKLTAKAPENWCLEDYFPFGIRPIFRGKKISFREGRSCVDMSISRSSCLQRPKTLQAIQRSEVIVGQTKPWFRISLVPQDGGLF